MVTVRPLTQQFGGQTFPLHSSKPRPDMRSLPQLGVGEPSLAGHGPGSCYHRVQSVLSEVVMSARPGEEETVRLHLLLCTYLTGVTAVNLTGPLSVLPGLHGAMLVRYKSGDNLLWRRRRDGCVAERTTGSPAIEGWWERWKAEWYRRVRILAQRGRRGRGLVHVTHQSLSEIMSPIRQQRQ